MLYIKKKKEEEINKYSIISSCFLSLPLFPLSSSFSLFLSSYRLELALNELAVRVAQRQEQRREREARVTPVIALSLPPSLPPSLSPSPAAHEGPCDFLAKKVEARKAV